MPMTRYTCTCKTTHVNTWRERSQYSLSCYKDEQLLTSLEAELFILAISSNLLLYRLCCLRLLVVSLTLITATERITYRRPDNSPRSWCHCQFLHRVYTYRRTSVDCSSCSHSVYLPLVPFSADLALSVMESFCFETSMHRDAYAVGVMCKERGRDLKLVLSQ